ncbi:MAG TPA: DUF1003 domain-containing protein [Patescibacteria group bacterium]|nr:DUF1003 domain-containing protein [Patescibacteria group bacterium]
MPKKDRKPALAPLFQPVSPEKIVKNIHSFEGKLANFVAGMSGNMWFVYLHIVWFSFWILANHGTFRPSIRPFDPFPYGLLTMIVSLEAIFLSTFILINQNRQSLADVYRELEYEKGQQEEEEQQEDLEEDVEDIQKDIDDIKNAMSFIQSKLTSVEKSQGSTGNGNGGSH